MSTKIVSIVGATGLTGNKLLELLIADTSISCINLLTRRPISGYPEKVNVRLVNFSDYESVRIAVEDSDAVFSCIGTTQKNVKGNNELYYKIDYDIPLMVARCAKDAGCNAFFIIGSVGADAGSRFFYTQLKGKLELALQQLQYSALYIFRPSFILGKRQERRLLERITQPVFRAMSVLFLGSLTKYKPITASKLVAAMYNAWKNQQPGVHFYEYKEIVQVSRL